MSFSLAVMESTTRRFCARPAAVALDDVVGLSDDGVASFFTTMPPLCSCSSSSGRAKRPMLEPADSQEACLFAKRAFELSEEYDTPVFHLAGYLDTDFPGFPSVHS